MTKSGKFFLVTNILLKDQKTILWGKPLYSKKCGFLRNSCCAIHNMHIYTAKIQYLRKLPKINNFDFIIIEKIFFITLNI